MSVKRTNLHQLRTKLIDLMIDVLDNGEEVVTKDGQLIRVKPSASMINVARQLLKDNGIDREEVEPCAKPITEELPFADPEVLTLQQVQQITGPPIDSPVPFSEE